MRLINENDIIAGIAYKLFKSFDTGGNPVYIYGTSRTAEVLQQMKGSLRDAHKVAHPYSTTSIGELNIELESGQQLKLGLVFDPGARKYNALVYKEGSLYHHHGKS